MSQSESRKPGLEGRSLELLKEAHMLIVDDEHTDYLKKAANEKRGEGAKEIQLAPSVEGSKSKIDQMLRDAKSGEHIIVIHDLKILYDANDESPSERNGIESILYIQQSVQKWNDEHKEEKPLDLTLVINSSKIANPDQRAEFESQHGIDLSKTTVSPEKFDYMPTLMSALEKKVS